MKAIFINSKKQEITEVEINLNNFKEAYKLIGCQMIEQVSGYFNNGDCFLVDEEGLLNENINESFSYPTQINPIILFGNALIVNSSFDSENYQKPKTSIEQLRKKIKF
jgi:hypothetical protein